jgi:hypothetical protein
MKEVEIADQTNEILSESAKSFTPEVSILRHIKPRLTRYRCEIVTGQQPFHRVIADVEKLSSHSGVISSIREVLQSFHMAAARNIAAAESNSWANSRTDINFAP